VLCDSCDTRERYFMIFDWFKAHDTPRQKIARLNSFERIRLMILCPLILLVAVTALPWLLTDMKQDKVNWAIQRNLNVLDRSVWDLTQILEPHYAGPDAKARIRRKLDGDVALREDLTHMVFQFEEEVVYRFSTSTHVREATELLLDMPFGEFRPRDVPELEGIERQGFYGVSRQAFDSDGTVAGVLVLAVSLENLVQETSARAGRLALIVAALLALAAVASVWTIFLLVTCPREDVRRA